MGTKRSTTGGQHSFAQIPSANIQRSSFDRSCGLKTTFDAGDLIPIFVDEALPGDTMSLSVSTFARLATPLHPIMDNIYLDTHFFSVPIRLIWDNWQKFNGEQDNPGDSTDFLIPTVTANFYAEGHLGDYMGLPVNQGPVTSSSLWFRAYNLIWNEWFRDENLQDSRPNNKGDGPDSIADYFLQKRGKRHDYMTSCLPFPQKGPNVELPLGTSAPVAITGTGAPTYSFLTSGDDGVVLRAASAAATPAEWALPQSSNDPGVWDDPALSGVADLSSATSATINQIREAFQIQKMFERDARGGTRYTEVLRAHFGVVSPDQRLQRPEYLGGGSSPLNIHPVAQTSGGVDIADDTPQGNLAAFGTSSNSTHGFNKSFVEHCVILGFISARADLNYQQGLDRMFQRSTRFDFFWPALAHLGEQPVLNSEIFYDGDQQAQNDAVFGYQERYAEYRYKPSKITGAMRSNAATSLDTWHLAQDFSTLPILGDTFIQENPPIDRIIAVTDEPHFLLDAFFKFRCARPMPMYGVPGNIDRF